MKFKGRNSELDQMDRIDTSLITCTTTQLHSVQTFMYTMVIAVGRYVTTNTTSIMMKVRVAFC